jgi:hypothetical protein
MWQQIPKIQEKFFFTKENNFFSQFQGLSTKYIKLLMPYPALYTILKYFVRPILITSLPKTGFKLFSPPVLNLEI